MIKTLFTAVLRSRNWHLPANFQIEGAWHGALSFQHP